MPPALFDLGAQLAEMDRLGIAMRAVCPPPFALAYAGAPGAAADLNRALARAVTVGGSRFVGLGTVPLHRPEQAAAELRRCMADLGLRGVTVGSDPGAGRELDAPDLEPFWAAAEALGALILLHPSEVPGAARMGRHHLRNLVGNPLATAHAAARLIFGGVLDRHPGLRIVLSHGGGALPWIAGRLDQGYRVRPECATACALPPSAYLRRFWYDTLVFEAGARRWLKERVGPERVLYGTDTPFDMGDAAGIEEGDHREAARLLGVG
jgi:aminocarboxymuconate-semialdehyde decarboxylase